MPAAADASAGDRATTGDGLLRYCTRASGVSQTACQGYIAGVADAIAAGLVRGRGGPLTVCIPAAVTAGDRAAVVVAWLLRHSDRMAEPAAGLVVAALAEKFPCAADQ